MPEQNGSDLSPGDSVTSVEGVGPARSDSLVQAGYETVEDLQLADLSELIGVIPAHVARDVKEIVGDSVRNVSSVVEAKKQARDIPGAKGKVVKIDGEHVPKVLRQEEQHRTNGATVTIRKG